MKKVSAAAMFLCLWVRAMDVYGRMFRSVEPKREKLERDAETRTVKLSGTPRPRGESGGSLF